MTARPSAGDKRFDLSDHELATLQAVVDVVIPPDGWPGGWDVVFSALIREHAAGPSLQAVLRVTLEGYYGGPAPAGVSMVGFRPVPEGVTVFDSGPPFGVAHKAWMRQAAGAVIGAMGIGQEIPDQRSAVSIDRQVTDRFGMPAARIRGAVHPTGTEINGSMDRRLREWIAEVGGKRFLEFGGAAGGPPVVADKMLREGN